MEKGFIGFIVYLRINLNIGSQYTHRNSSVSNSFLTEQTVQNCENWRFLKKWTRREKLTQRDEGANRSREQQGQKGVTGYAPQNRTADASDAWRVRHRCTSTHFLLANRAVHLPYLARGREWDSLENRLLIRDIWNSGDRAVGTRRRWRCPWGRRTQRLIARQGCRGTHGTVTSVSSSWKRKYWIETEILFNCKYFNLSFYREIYNMYCIMQCNMFI